MFGKFLGVVLLAASLSGCGLGETISGTGVPQKGAVTRVKQLCEEDSTVNVTVNATLDCDKSHDNKTATPTVVQVPAATE